MRGIIEGAGAVSSRPSNRKPLIVSQTECNVYFGGAPFVAPDGCCLAESFTTVLAPVLTEDVSGFVPPFHVE